jgi:hypothetical protein
LKKGLAFGHSQFGKICKANPNNADGFNLLGFSLRNAKRYPEAIFNYKKRCA